jgi:hypothetical protein
MEWLYLITMLCSHNKVDLDVRRPDCMAHFQKCVQKLSKDQMILDALGPDEKDIEHSIATWLNTSVKVRNRECGK